MDGLSMRMRRRDATALISCTSALIPAVAIILYWQSNLAPDLRFPWIYAGVVVDETLLLVAVAALVIPALNRSLRFFRRRVTLPLPARVLALLVMTAGLLIFAFWTTVDLLSGYNSFPSYAFLVHPYLATIYRDSGLEAVSIPDKNRVLGFVSFCTSVLAFMALRLGSGIGRALRDGIFFFAAPLVIAFEIALLCYAPLEMYWHVAAFAPWSLGRYITPVEFEQVMHSQYQFTWAGNVYLLSNWFALLAASGLLVLGVAREACHGRQA